MKNHPEHLAVTESETIACSSAEEAIAHVEQSLKAGPLQIFMECFHAALGGSPIAEEPPPRKELTDLDKDRIRKALEKRTRKEQEKHEQRQRSAAGQVPPI